MGEVCQGNIINQYFVYLLCTHGNKTATAMLSLIFKVKQLH